MIEAILNDAVDLTSVADVSPFETFIDYAAEKNKRNEATRAWKALTAAERSAHNDKIENFLRASGTVDFNSAEAQRAKNLLPEFLKGKLYADFSKAEDYDAVLGKLLRRPRIA